MTNAFTTNSVHDVMHDTYHHLQVVDEAKSILSQNTTATAKKKMRVSHYVALLKDFGVPKAEYSEERSGKTVQFKQKQLVEFFWSRDDVVERYCTYEDGDSGSSFEEVSESDYNDSFDSDDWSPNSLTAIAAARKRWYRQCLFRLQILVVFF